jgi:threonine aldolase
VNDRDLDELRDRCTRFLHWHGPPRPAAMLRDIPPETAPDRYGEGGVVAELEGEVATLLGKPAAVFMPSGTMGQQAALRVHADHRSRRTVVFHPTCHLELHEGGAYRRLHRLVGRSAGDPNRLLTVEDLRSIAEPPAALLLELPQREIGGLLPRWEELEAQVGWARDRGAAVHMDGARLWECTPFYERTLAAIAALFDTVYVSFYKGLGGLAGCCVAGPDEVVAEIREWRTRQGGTLFALWPYAASDLAALRRSLPLMPRYFEHAREVAAALREIPGVEVVPDPPHTPLMHVLLATTAEAFQAAAVQLAEEEGVWTWARTQTTASPNLQKVELVVGDATLEFTADEAAAVVARLLRPRQST